MSEQRLLVLQKGLIGACALVALIVFAGFYTVVSGAVQRGPRQRLANVDPVAQATPATTAQRSVGRGSALLGRVGN